MKNQFTPEQESWLQALESGEYKQTEGYLAIQSEDDTLSYCCLGLCEIEIMKRKYRITSNSHVAVFTKSSTTVIAELLDETIEAMHFYDAAGAIRVDYLADFYDLINRDEDALYITTLCSNLAGYNDAGATFKQIAYAIRQLPQAVFTNFDDDYKGAEQ